MVYDELDHARLLREHVWDFVEATWYIIRAEYYLLFRIGQILEMMDDFLTVASEWCNPRGRLIVRQADRVLTDRQDHQ